MSTSERLKRNSAKFREAHPERVAAAQHAYFVANKEKIAARKRQHYAENKARMVAEARAYGEAFPERLAAKSAVRTATRASRLIPLPCWVCGIEQTEAHHADYGAPLDVVWLCRAHHNQLHQEAVCLQT